MFNKSTNSQEKQTKKSKYLQLVAGVYTGGQQKPLEPDQSEKEMFGKNKPKRDPADSRLQTDTLFPARWFFLEFVLTWNFQWEF